MKLNGFFELELPSAPDTMPLKLARGLCAFAWSTTAAFALLGMRTLVLEQQPLMLFLTIALAVVALLLSAIVLSLRDKRDGEYWTEARIFARHYPIWWMAFGSARRFGRRP